MLLRSSCVVYPNLHLITLGATCRYAVSADDGSIVLTDPGATCHVLHLEERLSRLNLIISKLTSVAITHLDADRIAGLALLRRLVPEIAVYGTAAMHSLLRDGSFVQKLWEADRELTAQMGLEGSTPEIAIDEFKEALRIDRVLVDGDVIQVDEDVRLRSVTSPGHREHSVSYLLIPHEFLIVDETFGYYHGKKLSAPGGDFSLPKALSSMKKFDHLELSGIGFPYVGAVTGALVRKHIDSVAVNASDLIEETKRALKEGVAVEDVQAQIREAFYTTSLRDPCFVKSLQSTFDAVWKQIVTT